MQVFGGLISPFVRKVCLVAAQKEVPFELVLANPGNAMPEFVAASPFGKIPAIKDGDYGLCDSSAIIAYLEAKHSAHPVIPAEAEARGRTVWFDEFADTILARSMQKILFNRFVGPKFMKVEGNEAEAREGEAELPRLFAYLEGVVPARGWLVGETITLADLAVASVLRSLRYVNWEPDAESYPRLGAWYGKVRETSSWQQIAAIEDAPRVKRQ
ncbi:glutathione S-transferase family protein [Novosphingobium sp. G106]|uniref:glutathione S-transferase family protein n=1 Tax=Novosphingobium sp. G106 TaxID=2849500 RepID=UPI001C2D8DA6|nr:glutathione S-transferase family protein [Novosphingobium sp. G106]MBV1688077.1 glutathione S-transferase family protein [Novosphingobium sp. G106]